MVANLRSAIWGLFIALLGVAALWYQKDQGLQRFQKQSEQILIESLHEKVNNQFNGVFFFYYQDSFVPELQKIVGDYPSLDQVQIFGNADKDIIYDSLRPLETGPEPGKPYEKIRDEALIASLSKNGPSVFLDNFHVRIVIPRAEHSIYYSFFARELKQEILLKLTGILLIALLVAVANQLIIGLRLFKNWGNYWSNLSGLRPKFFLTIILINFISGLIMFYSLSQQQTQEQTERIKLESQIFARFTKQFIMREFRDHFYFYYQDKFKPAIDEVIAPNENLVGIRIVSVRTRSILYDSEVASKGPKPAPPGEELGQFKPDPRVEAELKGKGIAIRDFDRKGEPYFEVTTVYVQENQGPTFYVQYIFSFSTLDRSIANIRKQILLDLIPSLLLGLIIAFVFAQLLISPIKKLVSALRKVTAGDYEVSVDMQRSDEIGDLLVAFNKMTLELRQKAELRKYLSKSTYRQVMQIKEFSENNQIRGSRVKATVLISDIRNFVSYCESQDAEEVTNMLNEYFSLMVEVVHKFDGEVDKFIGDAILAVFYTTDDKPLSNKPDDSITPTESSLNAIYCALEMQKKLEDFNRSRVEKHKAPIQIGIGINYGEIISGPIGAKDRMDFTVIGDVVNVASRLEELSKGGRHSRIMFSSSVEKLVRGLMEYQAHEGEHIRGKRDEINVYELIRIIDLKLLVANLQSSDMDLKARSVDLLGHSGNLQAIPYLIEVLGDRNEGIRMKAAVALRYLAKVDDEKTLDALFRSVNEEHSDKVISALITSIGRLCHTDRIFELERFLRSKNERIVANAVEAIGRLHLPRSTDLLLPLLTSRSNRVKANAAMALFAAGHTGVVDSMKPMMLHSDPLMRSSAAFAIGELTALAHREQMIEQLKSKTSEIKVFLGELQECVPMLVSLLKDQEPMVKRQAIIALGKIKDRSAVLPIIDNVDLEHDSKEVIQEVAAALRSIGSHKLVREVLEKFL